MAQRGVLGVLACGLLWLGDCWGSRGGALLGGVRWLVLFALPGVYIM